MSVGFRVDPGALESAAAGIEQTLADLQAARRLGDSVAAYLTEPPYVGDLDAGESALLVVGGA